MPPWYIAGEIYTRFIFVYCVECPHKRCTVELDGEELGRSKAGGGAKISEIFLLAQKAILTLLVLVSSHVKLD